MEALYVHFQNLLYTVYVIGNTIMILCGLAIVAGGVHLLSVWLEKK